jgi:hypothetical protein
MPELLICRNGTNSSEILRENVGAQFRSLRHTLRFARVRWTTLAYLEKVRSQLLSLRHALGSQLSSAVDEPQNPQQTETFQVNDRTGDYRRDGNLRRETTFFSEASYFAVLVQF